MFKLIAQVFKRIVTLTTNPIRMGMMRLRRFLSPNVISAKVTGPVSQNVKALFTLKPQSREDYISIFGLWVYKKLLFTLIFLLCVAAILLCNLLPPADTQAAQPRAVVTDVTFRYDDMEVAAYSGMANILDAAGNLIYTGEVSEGICSGNGTLYTPEGVLRYQGEFDRNRFAGRGVLYYPDGVPCYEGEFADNLFGGEGALYDREGRLVYEGGFASGQYSGQGRLMDQEGRLSYEGGFLGGLYHGMGTAYQPGGMVRYSGEYFEGLPQGIGTLYNGYGKPVYTGVMQAGEIGYPSLVGLNLAQVEEAFPETPGILYTSDAACFFFEAAGVIVTVDARVRVQEWSRPQAGEDSMYYMPEELEEAVSFPSSDSSEEETAVPDTPPEVRETRGGGISQHLRPMAWYTDEDSSESSSSSSQESSRSRYEWEESSSSEASREESAGGGESEAASARAEETSLPEFIERTQALYFEIDKDVWQTEAELDKTKLTVRRVTVLSPPENPDNIQGVELTDNIPPSLEDCAGIDYLRRSSPTVFSNILFEIDKRNRLFQRIWNISYAGKIVRRSYRKDDLVYRYCYQLDDPQTLMYFSIER